MTDELLGPVLNEKNESCWLMKKYEKIYWNSKNS
jgi:hypothetical protein